MKEKRNRCAPVLAAALALAAPIAVAAAASPLPKVTLRSLPSSVSPGQKLSFRGKARAGSHGTRAVEATFALSTDRKLSAKDVRLGRLKIKSIAPHNKLELRVKLKVPSSATPGSYHFLVCLKPKGKRSGNRCRSLRSMTVEGAGNGVFPGSIPRSLRGITPHPRSATPHLDNADAVTGRVTPGSGGTLSTTSGDGTKYTLKVPAGAVISPLTVTMTPLSSVGGLGMSGGFVGGVQMAPNGLQLLNPARLTIVPTSGAPTSGRTAFGYEGTGQNVGLLPRDPGSSLSFELTHFSGGGVGSATGGDLAAQYNHAPAGTAAQFQQELQRLSPSDRLQTFNQYYTSVLKPKLEAALGDESLAPAATTEALAAVRQMEILGSDVSATRQEIFGFILRILKNAFNRSYDRCVNNHDPSQTYNLLGYLRQLEILGGGGEVDASKTWKCVWFKLDYQVDFSHQSGSNIKESMGVESLGAPIEYDGPKNVLDGELPLTVTHYTFEHYLCTPSQYGGTTKVTEQGFAKVNLSPNPKQEQKQGHSVITYGPPAITLVIDHGTIEVTHNCASPPDHDPSFYHGEWHHVFPDLERSGANGPSTLGPSLWTLLGGAVYAKTNLGVRHVDVGSDHRTGNLRFTLHHTPG